MAGIAKEFGLGKPSKGEAEKVIAELVKKNGKMILEQGERALGPLMGDAMKELKGKVPGKEISEILKREIKKLRA